MSNSPLPPKLLERRSFEDEGKMKLFSHRQAIGDLMLINRIHSVDDSCGSLPVMPVDSYFSCLPFASGFLKAFAKGRLSRCSFFF
ncbi:hypothetical protein FKM82_000054 [Ascaphus truei]